MPKILSPVVMDKGAIQDMAKALLERVMQRFPKRGMTARVERLVEVSSEIQSNIDWMKRGSVLLWLIPILFFVGLGVLGWKYHPDLKLKFEVGGVTDLAQLVDSTIQSVVFLGAGLGYLFFSTQRRFKRGKAFQVAGALETFCHVVNLGQLDKDPARLYRSSNDNTEKSPNLEMTPLELECYLDYCSETLSILAAIAAYYKQALSDDLGREAFAEVEENAGRIANKIWQKVSILTSYKTSGAKLSESKAVPTSAVAS